MSNTVNVSTTTNQVVITPQSTKTVSINSGDGTTLTVNQGSSNTITISDNVVNTSLTPNTVNITTPPSNGITVTDLRKTITVNQGITSTVQVASIGPQGPKGDTGATGPQGPAGEVQDTGSLLTTASVSLNILTFTKGDDSTFDITVDTGSQFLTSTNSPTKTGGSLKFNDNIQLTFGNSNDLKIYHNGYSNIIEDTGTGGLTLRGNNVYLQDDVNGDYELFAQGLHNGAFEIFYNGDKKFETTAVGATITGSLNVQQAITTSIISASESIETDQFTASLTENYIWVGNSNNQNTEIPITSLPGYFPFTYGLFNQTGSSIPVTGTDEGSLLDGGVGTLSVPADGFQKGDAFHAILTGQCSFNNNDILNIRVKGGATSDVVLAETGDLTLAGATNQKWKLEIYFSIYETGRVGEASIASSGTFMYTKDASNDFQGINFSFINSSSFGTTVPNTLAITAQFDNPGNSIFSKIFTLNKTY